MVERHQHTDRLDHDFTCDRHLDRGRFGLDHGWELCRNRENPRDGGRNVRRAHHHRHKPSRAGRCGCRNHHRKFDLRCRRKGGTQRCVLERWARYLKGPIASGLRSRVAQVLTFAVKDRKIAGRMFLASDAIIAAWGSLNSTGGLSYHNSTNRGTGTITWDTLTGSPTGERCSREHTRAYACVCVRACVSVCLSLCV